MVKVLFCLKYRENSWSTDPYNCSSDNYGSGGHLHSGLFNSARFMVDMLNDNGVEAKLVHCLDNNYIHREAVAYEATHVILEGYWVVPEKFEVLKKALPNVEWIIRNHSETPFLSGEGMGMDWTLRYIAYDKVTVACNATRATEQMEMLAYQKYGNSKGIIYLPNYYPVEDFKPQEEKFQNDKLNIGCFGAIRPLKNQLQQAIAAIEFAGWLNKPMDFHINGSRVEMGGAPILKNLRQLFEQFSPTYNLIEHDWNGAYHDLVASMDLGMQVSFSETFNIVAADFTKAGVPIVTSKEIFWSERLLQADPTDPRDIICKMKRAYFMSTLVPNFNRSKKGLIKYDNMSRDIWISYFRG